MGPMLQEVDAGETESAAAQQCEVSVILPCLDEAETVGACVTKALQTLQQLNVRGEVVVVDNGSIDASVEIAARSGARIVNEP